MRNIRLFKHGLIASIQLDFIPRIGDRLVMNWDTYVVINVEIRITADTSRDRSIGTTQFIDVQVN